MRVGILVSGIGVRPGFEHTFSGHTQVALQTATLLRQAGHEVNLLTSLQHQGLTLPATMPADVPLHLLTDGRGRGRVGVEFRRHGGYRPFAIARQIREIHQLVRRLRLDVLHLFGFQRTAALAGLLRLTGLACPTVVTTYDRPESHSWRWLGRSAGQIISATRYVHEGWLAAGVPSVQIPHGSIRSLTAEQKTPPTTIESRSRVLFWRVLAPEAGGDLCLEAFDKLAPEFRDISFDLALRPSVHEMPGADLLSRRHGNVRVYRFPYEDGVTIGDLVTASLCAVFPFRRLTIHPQLSIVETLAAGTACVASNIESVPEIVQHGVNGMLVNTADSRDLTETLRRLLQDRRQLWQFCRNARPTLEANWNWHHYVGQIEQTYRQVCGSRRDIRPSRPRLASDSLPSIRPDPERVFGK